MVNKETASFNWWLHTPSESILRIIDLNYKIQCEIRQEVTMRGKANYGKSNFK